MARPNNSLKTPPRRRRRKETGSWPHPVTVGDDVRRLTYDPKTQFKLNRPKACFIPAQAKGLGSPVGNSCRPTACFIPTRIVPPPYYAQVCASVGKRAQA